MRSNFDILLVDSIALAVTTARQFAPIRSLAGGDAMRGKPVSRPIALGRLYSGFATAAIAIFLRPRPVFANRQSQRLLYIAFLTSESLHRDCKINWLASRGVSAISFGMDGTKEIGAENWIDMLPLENGSHRSAKVRVPKASYEPDASEDSFDKAGFRNRLEATVTACREMGKSSLWMQVPMSRASLIEDMNEFGLRFHHVNGDDVILNVWLKDSESKIPEFATHNVGVGAVVVNSRNEILCVRELRNNYMKWKTPTGLSDLGEQIDDAACREVLEETGIQTRFHSLLGFRQTHGLAHGRSDLFFVCRLDPLEEFDCQGDLLIPTPVPQADEIQSAEWVPLEEYRRMVNGEDGSGVGHPMMKHVIEVFDAGRRIEKTVVSSVIPGRKPNSVYFPVENNKNR